MNKAQEMLDYLGEGKKVIVVLSGDGMTNLDKDEIEFSKGKRNDEYEAEINKKDFDVFMKNNKLIMKGKKIMDIDSEFTDKPWGYIK